MTSMQTELTSREARVHEALGAVTDPEYPDVSIVDLGLVESVDFGRHGTVAVGLIPTFSGCPALAMIAADVNEAITAVEGVVRCEVRWLPAPVWSTDRVSESARVQLRNDYTVVLRKKDGTLLCPVCGSNTVTDQSSAGPTRCRSVAWCGSCRNVVEVMR